MYGILNEKKVLVVDDLATIRTIVSQMLKENGVQVLEANRAEVALRMAKDHAIDAFLLDIKMPEMNGIDLCREIRSIDKYRTTPVMFVTSMEQGEALDQALEAGGDDFITKPIQAAVLRGRLTNALQKHAYLREIELISLSLQRYVSPRTEEIARAYAKTGVLPAPRLQEVAVLFSDVRGFTEMSQDIKPEVLFDLLSEHLASLVNLVYKHGGYIDKFSGDGLMAVFDEEDMVLKSCLCALEILDASKRRAGGKSEKIHQLGIGIHVGSAVIGNLGSAAHLDYTLVGKTVNLAARLCGIADLSIVVSEAVRKVLAHDARVRFHSERKATIRGFKQPITIYELSRGKASG